ncbi:ribosome recycling factor family protein [Photobacterium minamisatsumaniensis]|uniref:ribosome recycling factor family protein n=1 Tax=Photobacterium minamisatsumaniensis TaxID=2910233 RepID=UPI003D100B39
MIENTLTIALPSLIHRIGGESVKKAKDIALECGCELKRVRRSRNWQVVGDAVTLAKLTEQLKAADAEAMYYLNRKIDEKLSIYHCKLEPLEEQLKTLVVQNPNITLAELMQQTNCSITEARVARFEADAF